jgi:hypothetical protein
MAVRTVAWEDEDETVRTARARVEDTVPFRRMFSVEVPIRSGTKAEVSWRRDDCSGMNKWCREEDGEYVVGMKRDRIANKKLTRMVARAHEPGAREVDSPPARQVATPRVRSVDMPSTHRVETPIAREIHKEVQQEERHEARRGVCSERSAAIQIHALAMIQNTQPAHRRRIPGEL